jgi:hypothetical protein
MKRHAYTGLLIAISSIFIPLYATENSDIILKSKWKELCNNNQKCTDFGGKWVVVGSITFKKRCKQRIFVDKLNLCWQGENIDNLTASLYRKKQAKDFLAIEDNLICDGLWSQKTQTLIFDFDKEKCLDPTTVFYIVLTIPSCTEAVLKKGQFCLENSCLPAPFKECAEKEKLIFAVNDKSYSSTHQ